MCFEYNIEIISKYKGGRFLVFRDKLLGSIKNPGIIVKEYRKSVFKIKQMIYGENADNEKIDHHKIAALFISSFLKYQPFYLDIPAETKNPKISLYVKLANEYFLIDYLEAIFKAANNDFDGELKMAPDYEVDFIKLLYSYKNKISTLNPLELANTICLIERQYFIPSKPSTKLK